MAEAKPEVKTAVKAEAKAEVMPVDRVVTAVARGPVQRSHI